MHWLTLRRFGTHPRSLALAASIMLIAMALPAQQPAGAAIDNTVTVSATGQASAQPDTAIVHWDITGQNAQLKSAYAEAQRQAAQVRTLLRTQGFAPQVAHWSSYSVQPQFDYKTNRVTGYTVSVSLDLDVADFMKIGPLLDAAGSAGITALRSVRFELKNQQSARSAAIADAYLQASTEADAFARAAGRQIRGLVHASVSVNTPFAPQPMMRVMAAASVPPPTAEFSPRSITVNAQATVVFRLSP